MERTTVYLDAALKRRLKELAELTGESEASIIRESLDRYLSSKPRRTLRPVGRSRDGGVAHRVDEALDDLGFGQE